MFAPYCASACAIESVTLLRSSAGVSMQLPRLSLMRYRFRRTAMAFSVRTGALPGGGVEFDRAIINSAY